MRYALLAASLVASVSAHGVLTEVNGANGVDMPGLSIIDGTPRDCSSNGCGSQADTSIIREREFSSGKSGALGRTQGGGPVDAEAAIANFMGTSGGKAMPTNKGASGATGVEDDLSGLAGLGGGAAGKTQRRDAQEKRQLQGLIGAITGQAAGGNGAKADGAKAAGANGAKAAGAGAKKGGGAAGLLGGLGGALGGGALGGALGGGGGNKNNKAAETMVAATAGKGASDGLPTCAEDGTIQMTYRQINQDGAGPLKAAVDGTSGGKDANAFQNCEMVNDVPGLGVQGLSLASNTDFKISCKMPAGMTCTAKVAGADNVCVVRVQNGNTAAGPFGGSGAFTQSKAARKRAIAYRLKKRMAISRN